MRKRRCELLLLALVNLFQSYDVPLLPSAEFDIETLATVTTFDEFEILRDLAVRLGDAQPVEQVDDGAFVTITVHAHHLIGLVAALPDVTGAADVPEPELSMIVQGLCYAYLVERSPMPNHRTA